MNNHNGCCSCYFYRRGEDSNYSICLWFEKHRKMKGGKPIPEHIILKGCNLYTTKIVGYILEKFGGKFI